MCWFKIQMHQNQIKIEGDTQHIQIHSDMGIKVYVMQNKKMNSLPVCVSVFYEANKSCV